MFAIKAARSSWLSVARSGGLPTCSETIVSFHCMRVFAQKIAACELSPGSGGICVLSRGENMNDWIDLLIVIPSWLGVFAVIGALVATVAG